MIAVAINYIIYQNDTEINRIFSDADFVEAYCSANGYTYEVEPLPPDPGPEPEPEPEPDPDDYVTYGELAAAIREGVNSVE